MHRMSFLAQVGLLGFAVTMAVRGGAQATLIADAHVNASAPAVNSGGISNVNVGAGYSGLLQFDLSLLPAGTTPSLISRAVLVIYLNRVDMPGAVTLQPLTTIWREAGRNLHDDARNGNRRADGAGLASGQLLSD